MAFDTVVEVSSKYESKCSLKADEGISLSNYMQLPVEQYVCIKMPLDATLSRIDGNQFNMTVPPVKFFNLDVSPSLICYVTQSEEGVIIESNECYLRGSPFVANLNGCFKMKIKTVFSWIDSSVKKSILSASSIFVEVDPPVPFKYFGKAVLETTGSLAMSIALRQIENAFVTSLSNDYERWVTNKDYRMQRMGLFPISMSDLSVASASLDREGADIEVEPVKEEPSSRNNYRLIEIPIGEDSSGGRVKDYYVDERLTDNIIVETSSLVTTADTLHTVEVVQDKEVQQANVNTNGDMSKDDKDKDEALPLETQSQRRRSDSFNLFSNSNSNGYDDAEVPEVLTDDICLLPGEPIVRIEEAPSNSRRIFTGIDIMSSVDSVWKVLTNYEDLAKVVPSLVKNEVVFRTPEGGARLSQIGGAKVLPGITFTAKAVLDVKIYTEDNPIPADMVASYSSEEQDEEDDNKDNNKDKGKVIASRDRALQRDLFPRPFAITSLPHRDITMQNVLGEGDFDHYQGIWRMQSLPNCVIDGCSDATRLTYAVEMKPKGLLPVRLIEGRIASDLKANLLAIRSHVEALTLIPPPLPLVEEEIEVQVEEEDLPLQALTIPFTSVAASTEELTLIQSLKEEEEEATLSSSHQVQMQSSALLSTSGRDNIDQMDEEYRNILAIMNDGVDEEEEKNKDQDTTVPVSVSEPQGHVVEPDTEMSSSVAQKTSQPETEALESTERDKKFSFRRYIQQTLGFSLKVLSDRNNNNNNDNTDIEGNMNTTTENNLTSMSTASTDDIGTVSKDKDKEEIPEPEEASQIIPGIESVSIGNNNFDGQTYEELFAENEVLKSRILALELELESVNYRLEAMEEWVGTVGTRKGR